MVAYTKPQQWKKEESERLRGEGYNHHSSQEHAIYGTSCLLLHFPNPTVCPPSNLRSMDLGYIRLLLASHLPLPSFE